MYLEIDTPTYKLYSTAQIGWATLLGSPIAGSILLAKNYARTGNESLGRAAIAYGTIATLIIFIAAFFLPEKVPNSVIPIACVLTMRQLTMHFQGSMLAGHAVRGGSTASTWGATGIGLLCLACILLLIIAVVFLLPESAFNE